MKARERLTSAALASVMALSLLPVQVTSLTVQAAEQENDFVALVQEAYAEPEMQYRPYARWWLAEGSHTDETLIESIHELYDAGYGGVEFVTLDESRFLDNETYAWGSPEWIHDIKVIIEECQKLGMSVSMTSGTHWATANLVSILPDEEAASQELGYVTVKLEGSDGTKASYKGYLPKCSLPANTTVQTLVKALAAKITERGSEGQTMVNITPSRIDLSSVIDITDQVKLSGDGSAYALNFTAPEEGDYDLFLFYQYGTGEAYSPAISKSYTINYLSTQGANALIDYWDSEVLTDEVQELIDQIDECDLYMDSLELSVHGQNTTGLLWCADMLEQFENRNTYSIAALLPLLIKTGGTFGAKNEYFYEPADEKDQAFANNLRQDFMQTQTELYTENCLQVLSDWLHSKHMKLRAENSYGAPFEISEPAKALDYIETESMEFGNELDSHRNMAGGAHLFNKRMSSETGAWISGNYVYDNNYYRQVFYMQYASGIQKTVTHGYSAEYGPEEYVQWPGFEGMDAVWSERFNKRQPASVDYAAQNLHFSRLQKALEEGVPQMDLAVMRTDYAFNNRLTNGGMMNFVAKGVYSNKAHTQDAYYWRDLELQNAGYTYDYFSPYLLPDEAVNCNDGLINADGVAYQALVLMEDELPLESAEKILAWAQDGLPVLFVNNAEEIVANDEVLKINTQTASVTGSNNTEDEALAKVVEQIKALDNVRTVESEADAYEALQELGVRPRVEYEEPNTVLLPVLRSTEDADYLYLYHYMYEEETDFDATVSLDGIFEPYFLDTWTGEVKPADNYHIENGRTWIDTELAPGETQIFVLKKDADLADGDRTEKTFETTEVSLKNWSLTVDSFEPGEQITRTETNEETGVTTTEAAYTTNHVELQAGELEKLLPWKDIAAVGATVSGLGTYETTVTIDEADLSDSTSITFRADSFEGGTAALWVNGKQVSVNMDRHSAEIKNYLQAGENTITVRVSTSLRNKMLEVGYEQGWNIQTPEVADYGMTGETKLIFCK
ncbi:MAG: hypothetical protein IJW67_12835 [Blautia sp.]|nr:hypothetical protein [Blautia sp.]